MEKWLAFLDSYPAIGLGTSNYDCMMVSMYASLFCSLFFITVIIVLFVVIISFIMLRNSIQLWMISAGSFD